MFGAYEMHERQGLLLSKTVKLEMYAAALLASQYLYNTPSNHSRIWEE